MRGAGILSIGGPVSDIELPNPRPLADDEALIAVRAAGVGIWDEIVRQGGWDVGIAPPMAWVSRRRRGDRGGCSRP